MKLKTIDAIIHKKITDFISTFPGEMQRVMRQNVIVTGGSIASMLLKESVNDFDIYFRNIHALKHVVDYLFESLPIGNTCSVNPVREDGSDRLSIGIKSTGILKPEITVGEDGNPDPKYQLSCITQNALSFTEDIQIVTRFVGDPDTIHSTYDYIHATNYWTYEQGLVTNKPALESLLTKELIYTGSKYPLASVIRSRKFIQRGWSINAGQYLKMIIQLNDLDLCDVSVLEDQLMGVDVAYFQALLNALERAKQDPTVKIDSLYIIQLVEYVVSARNIQSEDDDGVPL